MKLAVNIAREVCEWYGVNPAEISTFKMSDDPDENKNEKMALALICHFFTRKELRDFSMEPAQIARYFSIPEAKVVKALNQREYWNTSSGSYAMVKKKVETMIDNYLIKIYE